MENDSFRILLTHGYKQSCRCRLSLCWIATKLLDLARKRKIRFTKFRMLNFCFVCMPAYTVQILAAFLNDWCHSTCSIVSYYLHCSFYRYTDSVPILFSYSERFKSWCDRYFSILSCKPQEIYSHQVPNKETFCCNVMWRLAI